MAEYSKETCKGENCNSHFIQNKRKHLCGECVYKLKHGGRSRTEIAVEKQKEKQVLLRAESGKKARRFKITKPLITFNKRDKDGEIFAPESIGTKAYRDLAEALTAGTIDAAEGKIQSIKRVSVKKISEKQADINKEYANTCKQIDSQRDMICDGCGKNQGGDIVLSHSHIIARSDCKRIGRPELIYDENNIKLHCMDFGKNKIGCHTKWANPKKRKELLDYFNNMKFIKAEVPEMYEKYKAK